MIERAFGLSNETHIVPSPQEDPGYNKRKTWYFINIGLYDLTSMVQLCKVLGRVYHHTGSAPAHISTLYGCRLIGSDRLKGIDVAHPDLPKPWLVRGIAVRIKNGYEEKRLIRRVEHQFRPTKCTITFAGYYSNGEWLEQEPGVCFTWDCSKATNLPIVTLDYQPPEGQDRPHMYQRDGQWYYKELDEDIIEERRDLRPYKFMAAITNYPIEEVWNDSHTHAERVPEIKKEWYFIYGTLNGNVHFLKRILGRRDVPTTHATSVTGFEIRRWQRNAAMIAKPDNLVHGFAIELEGDREPERIGKYYGDKWRRCPVIVRFADGVERGGFAFVFGGDIGETGQGDLEQDGYIWVDDDEEYDANWTWGRETGVSVY